MPGRVRRHTNGLCHCCDVQFDQHPTQKFGRICYAWIDCTIYKLEEKLHKICENGTVYCKLLHYSSYKQAKNFAFICM